MPKARGAVRAANSMLPVPTRSSEQFSQVQPPCIAVETITAGKLTVTRGSIADENHRLRAAAAGAGDADARRDRRRAAS